MQDADDDVLDLLTAYRAHVGVNATHGIPYFIIRWRRNVAVCAVRFEDSSV